MKVLLAYASGYPTTELQKIFKDDDLFQAARDGREQTVRIILDWGLNHQTRRAGTYGYALRLASTRGHARVVKLLLERFADVNAHGGSYYGSPLLAASL
jgi:hypothetical protein